MKTIEVKLYQFAELSEEAKQRAIDNRRNSINHEFIIEEARETLNKFCDIFNIKYQSIDFSNHGYNSFNINIDDNILELNGFRLAKHIWNNYKHDIFKGKYYGKLVNTLKDGTPIKIDKTHPAGLRHVKRYSKIFLDDCCVLTGVCYDDDILKPIYTFLQNPGNKDFEDLLNDCVNNLCLSVGSEIDYRESEEGISEELNECDNDFLEDGSIY